MYLSTDTDLQSKYRFDKIVAYSNDLIVNRCIRHKNKVYPINNSRCTKIVQNHN